MHVIITPIFEFLCIHDLARREELRCLEYVNHTEKERKSDHTSDRDGIPKLFIRKESFC